MMAKRDFCVVEQCFCDGEVKYHEASEFSNPYRAFRFAKQTLRGGPPQEGTWVVAVWRRHTLCRVWEREIR